MEYLELIGLDKADVQMDLIRRQYQQIQERCNSGFRSLGSSNPLLFELYTIQEQVEKIKSRLNLLLQHVTDSIQFCGQMSDNIAEATLQAAIREAKESNQLSYSVHSVLPNSDTDDGSVVAVSEAIADLKVFLTKLSEICSLEELSSIEKNAYILQPSFLRRMEIDYSVGLFP